MMLSLARPRKQALVAGVFALLLSLIASLVFFSGNTSAAEYEGTWTSGSTIQVGPRSYTGPVNGTEFENEGADGCKSRLEFGSAGDMNKEPQSGNAKVSIQVKVNGTCESVGGTMHDVVFENSRTTPDAEAGEGPGDGDISEEEVSTCNVPAIGWIVCPTARLIAGLTDAAYAAIEQLMVFKPVEDLSDTSSDNTLYTVWNNIRNFANVAFIVAFFMIIFSQATSIGISAYGIKKMIPRLIVAAILVNLSYWICLLAVDVSNIVGAGMDGILKSSLSGTGDARGESPNLNASFFISNALAMTGIAVGAGAVVLTHGVVLVSLGMMFLIPAILALLVALVVLIGRQALLIMLIVLAPLAFVAYILPGTEDWFNRWRKIFITMLIFYPLMTILFTGAGVAAEIMRDVSTNPLVSVFSIGVQAFPLFATPFIIQWSGGLLGRVAGMVNNPNKGPLDRMRKGVDGWADKKKGRISNERNTKRFEKVKDIAGEKDAGKRRRRYASNPGAAWAAHQMKVDGESKAAEDNLGEAKIAAQSSRVLQDEQYALAMAGGDKDKIGVVQARAKAAEAEMQGKRVGAAAALVGETNVLNRDSKYFDKNKNPLTKDEAMARMVVGGEEIVVEDASGKRNDLKTDGYKRDAILDMMGKQGDVGSIDTIMRANQKRFNETQAELNSEMSKPQGQRDSTKISNLENQIKDYKSLKGQLNTSFESNVGSLMAKAPDLIKPDGAAFDTPNAATVGAWHGTTAARFNDYVNNLRAEGKNDVADKAVANMRQSYQAILDNKDLYDKADKGMLKNLSSIQGVAPASSSQTQSAGGSTPTPAAPQQQNYTTGYSGEDLRTMGSSSVNMIINSAGGASNLSNSDIDKISQAFKGQPGGETIIQQVTEVKNTRIEEVKAAERTAGPTGVTDSTGRQYPSGLPESRRDDYNDRMNR